MGRKPQSQGLCVYCEREMSKDGLTRHLSDCPRRWAAIADADEGNGEIQTLIHLQIQDANRPEFWLHLEMNGSASLKDLDRYLRAIWLECCGHLSEFRVGPFEGRKVAMTKKASEALQHGVQIMHYYDFGTTSETQVSALGVRQGKPTSRNPIALMARNKMPDAICLECDQPAAYLCQECLIEDQTSGMLCEAHAKTHPHDNYGEPIPVVNSPRLGMCGYEGPANPPY